MTSLFVNIDQLEPGEPLSPELVLVRRRSFARMRWRGLARRSGQSRSHLSALPTPPAKNSLTQTLGAVLLPRVAQLMLTFVVVVSTHPHPDCGSERGFLTRLGSGSSEPSEDIGLVSRRPPLFAGTSRQRVALLFAPGGRGGRR